MRQIQHPRIVSFIGFVVETFSIVMEYLPGGSLEQYIRKNRDTPWSDRLQCARDIAEGMAYLHSRTDLNGNRKLEVFHQDLKSANVLLCEADGILRAKISDG